MITLMQILCNIYKIISNEALKYINIIYCFRKEKNNINRH